MHPGQIGVNGENVVFIQARAHRTLVEQRSSITAQNSEKWALYKATTVRDRENEEGFLVGYDKMNSMDQRLNMESATIKNQIFVFQIDDAPDQGGVLIQEVLIQGVLIQGVLIQEDFQGHIFLL